MEKNFKDQQNSDQQEPLDLSPMKKPTEQPNGLNQDEPLDLSPAKRARNPGPMQVVVNNVVNEGPRRMEAINALLELSWGRQGNEPRCICGPEQPRASVIAGNCYVVLHYTVVTRNPLMEKYWKKTKDQERTKTKKREGDVLREILKLINCYGLRILGHFC